MDKSKLIFIIALFFIYCGQDTTEGPVENEALTGILTHVATFGDVDLPDEYLLAKPRDIAVNTNNEIFVVDELKIKVFATDGTPKRIIGGPGDGPGEFRTGREISINGQGYITMFGHAYETSVFSPTHLLFYY